MAFPAGAPRCGALHPSRVRPIHPAVLPIHPAFRATYALPPAWGRGRARLPGGRRCGRAAPVRGGGYPGCQPRPPGKGCRRAGPRRRAVGGSATGLRC